MQKLSSRILLSITASWILARLLDESDAASTYARYGLAAYPDDLSGCQLVFKISPILIIVLRRAADIFLTKSIQYLLLGFKKMRADETRLS